VTHRYRLRDSQGNRSSRGISSNRSTSRKRDVSAKTSDAFEYDCESWPQQQIELSDRDAGQPVESCRYWIATCRVAHDCRVVGQGELPVFDDFPPFRLIGLGVILCLRCEALSRPSRRDLSRWAYTVWSSTRRH
jgi:hypothetical protein